MDECIAHLEKEPEKSKSIEQISAEMLEQGFRVNDPELSKEAQEAKDDLMQNDD